MSLPETRPSLIIRLQGELDQLAWSEFVLAYESFLQQLLQRQGVPPDQVADVCQQLLLVMVRSVGRWSDDGQPASFRRWLNRVARNVVVQFMTRERRQIVGQGGTDFLEQIEQIPEPASAQLLDEYDFELMLWAAGQARAECKESSWKAFWATQIEGRAVADVADELGLSAGAIYMSRSRIMARIRAMIADFTDH